MSAFVSPCSLPEPSTPELLAPAGNYEKLQTALLYGADAVYVGGDALNLRASCEGVSVTELARAVDEADGLGARIYYCLNSFPLEKDMAALPAAIEAAAAAGVHGFIIADPGVLRLARQYAPQVPVHLSTQANTTNAESVRFWAGQGVERVNLARELSWRDIGHLRAACPDTELEVFVHGAVCLAVSGQCLMSAWLNDRPANAGRCTQPCRFEYRPFAACALAENGGLPCESSLLPVEERTRPGEALWQVGAGAGYSAVWAPQDLCLIRYLPWFNRIGMDALKIEGRMKGPGYLAHVVDVYGTALRGLGRRKKEARLAALNGGKGRACAATFASGQKSGPAAGPQTACEADPEGVCADFAVDVYMPDLLTTASRPLGSGFFLPGQRRNFTEEYLQKPGAYAPSFAFSAQPLLARLGESLRGASGNGDYGRSIEVRGRWDVSMNVEVMLPGMRRLVLASGSYALENHRGERVCSIGSGAGGVLYADLPELPPGIFIRAHDSNAG